MADSRRDPNLITGNVPAVAEYYTALDYPKPSRLFFTGWYYYVFSKPAMSEEK